MNGSDLVKAVANQCDLNQTEVAEALELAFDTIALALRCEEDVLISGFGKFEVRHHQSVVKRNPKTGEGVEVPAKRTLGFRPSRVLKRKVSGVK